MVKNPTPPTCQTKYDSRQHVWYYVFDDSHYANCTLIVPRGSKAAYQAAATWKNFTHIIEADFPSEVKRGDVNNDDIVDIDDVTQLISYVLGNGNDINLVAADVNDDGGIDIDDITVVINYILNGSWPELADIDMWYLAGDHIGIYPGGMIQPPWERESFLSILLDHLMHKARACSPTPDSSAPMTGSR